MKKAQEGFFAEKMIKTIIQYKKELLIAGWLTAILGEVYFYPFGTPFRFTIGVVGISFLILYFKDIEEMLLILFAGVTVFVFRVILGILVKGFSIEVAVQVHFPAMMFYFAYGIILRLMKIRDLITLPVNFVAAMSLADITGNIVELMIRRELSLKYFQEIFTFLVGVGILRAIITFSLYWLLERYKNIALKEEHERRYAELLDLLSQLKAELVYLKKSTMDLENAMKESYEIYNKLGGQVSGEEIFRIKKRALNLAKEIHEIKKDYLRISSGFSQIIPDEEKDGMSLNSLFDVIKINTERWMKTYDKKIQLKLRYNKNFIIKNYFVFLSIIGNLISNALDAVDNERGIINVSVNLDENNNKIFITVSDNGYGIDKKDLPFIFDPGFSTKMLENGELSTGLGLTHVKNLVEEMEGKVEVKTARQKGTTFFIEIPYDERYFSRIKKESGSFGV
ncbi:sensor histidine kinase [Thermovenabulum gondwanense]|uniref:histidine kinase n=1 Tax=Thermovenabulum gondwanense TaxID=520767 RepID=A0A162M5U1_9FIRM|nr:sensor histidine kinase [Thermovenabulum gondwanense]KYO64138.1 Sensor histidine kinase GlnK [Thermovenabulum gondwanense]